MTSVTDSARHAGIARVIAAFVTSAVLAACGANSQLTSITPQRPGANPLTSGMVPGG